MVDLDPVIIAPALAQRVPMFTAPTNPSFDKSVTDPSDPRSKEYRLPGKWEQTTTTDTLTVPSEGAVCVVTGHLIDGVDVDTKNGADVETERQALTACGVQILGEARTPSGGAHFYVASTGICTAANKANGVDFRGGSRDGSGRGFLFAAGTKRPKYDGAGYSWVKIPSLTLIDELDLDDQRDNLWTYLLGRDIEPRLTSTPPAATVAGEPVDQDQLPEPIRERLANLTVDDRSETFHGTVGMCKRAGYTQGETVTIVTPWCEGVGKYVGRIGAEVARTWPKISDGQEFTKYLDSLEETPANVDDQGAGNKTTSKRRLKLTAASDIEPERAKWLWADRMALGALSLIAGPEGLGKSTLGYCIVAQITQGTLPGELFGTPKSVIIAATEDSWAHTIVPRLIAHGADRARVFRVDVTTTLGFAGEVVLPADIPAMAEAATANDVALLVLDPLTSRLSHGLDTHKDSETRQALEPLVKFASESSVAIIGIMHFNKSGSTDPLSLVMASKAFTAVARSVSVVIKDPDDETERARLFNTVKNNLGRSDLDTMRFTITGYAVPTSDGDAMTGRLVWGDNAEGTIADALHRATETTGDKSATAEAAEWLTGYLTTQGDTADVPDINKAGNKAGHSNDSLKRARHKLGVTSESRGFPAVRHWSLPVRAQSEQKPRGESLTALTALTGGKEPAERAVRAVRAVRADGGATALTGDADDLTPEQLDATDAITAELIEVTG